MSRGEKSELLKRICWQRWLKIEIHVPKIKIKIKIKNKKSSQYFYNTFITSFKFQVAMSFYWWGKKFILVVGSTQN